MIQGINLAEKMQILEDASTGVTPSCASAVELRANSKNIGFVRRGYSSTGGAEAYLKRLAQGLLQEGFHVVLLGTGEWPVEEWPGGHVVTLPHQTLRQFAQAVLEYKKGGEIPIDLLFSLERVPGCDIFRAGDGVHAAWLERRRKRMSFLQRIFSLWQLRHREVLQLERELFCGEKKTHVIANSSMVAEEIRDYFNLPSSQMSIIPNGVPSVGSDTKEICSKVRKDLGLASKDFMVLFVGSGWERKGLKIAKEALELMVSSLTKEKNLERKVMLFVAGKGRKKKYASPYVRFLGPLKEDLHKVYAAADLFILPTLYDPFANASLEALASGVPVMTSASNGCSEVMLAGVHGSILNDSNDVEGFAAAMRSWYEQLQCQDFAKHTRNACHELGKQWSIDRNIESTLMVIHQLLAK